MTFLIPELRVGEPVRHKSLAIFPLFSDLNSDINYRLSDEGLADQTLLIEEIDEGGSVPELMVENKSDNRILFLEGEELVGAKQNRILNTSLLVAPRSKLPIPVSCVEQGRWRYRTRRFQSSGSHSPAKLRFALKASVSNSAKADQMHRSDQREIWNKVSALHADHNVRSGTAAMSAAFEKYEEEIKEYQKRFHYVEDAIGLAVAIGGKIVVLDAFDKPSTCKHVWNRLLSGIVFDAVEAKDTENQVDRDSVEKLVKELNKLPFESVTTVGEGTEYRAVSEGGDHASSLIFEETLIHGSLLVEAKLNESDPQD